MKKLNETFFAKENEVGLTSSSANHLCNVSKEVAKQFQEELNRISFVSEWIGTLNGVESKILKYGSDEFELPLINNKLDKIAELNAFNAWFREGIKAKDEALQAMFLPVSLEDKCKTLNLDLPTMPVNFPRINLITRQDVLNDLNVKDLNKIFTLEARASTVGKYINPREGSFYNARKNMGDKITNPSKTSGNDSNMVIYSYNISMSSDEVNSKFQELQNIHRNLEAELNGLNAVIDRKVTDENIKITNQMAVNAAQYSQDCREYDNNINAITQAYTAWINTDIKRIGALKLAIPEALKTIYEYLTQLGK